MDVTREDMSERAGHSEGAEGSERTEEVTLPPILTEPLEHRWTWFAHVDGEYSSSIVTLGTFATLQEFFCYKHHVLKPSSIWNGLQQGCVTVGGEKRIITAYSIFHDGVQPAWEDTANAEGGVAVTRVCMHTEELEAAWDSLTIDLLLAPPENCTGFRIVYRCDRRGTSYKFEVWTSSKEETVVNETCAFLHERVPSESYPNFNIHKSNNERFGPRYSGGNSRHKRR